MATTYFTPEQVAERLQLEVTTIYRYLRTKKLVGARISPKCWRIAPSDLYAFVEARKND